MSHKNYARSIDLSTEQTFRNLTNVKRFAIDIGGSLAKVAYSADLHIRAALCDDTENEGLIYKVTKTEETMTRLHFVKFETKYIESCLDFILTNLIDSKEFMRDKIIKVTGGGAYKYKDLITSKLGVQVDKEDEIECLIYGCNFLLKNIPDEAFFYRHHGNPDYCFLGVDQHVFPYLLVNIGSGVSLIKVESESKFQRIGGTSTGGGTFWGLGCLLTQTKSFDELLELAEAGDHRSVDMLMKDIYGSDYSQLGLGADTIASSFGKATRMDGEHFQKEDIVRSLLLSISNDIGQIAYLQAKQHGLSKIYFGGNFIRGHPLTMHTIGFAINYLSKGEVQALFLQHEGYLGAIGAFLKGAEEEDADKYSWGENMAGSSGLASPQPTFLERSHQSSSVNNHWDVSDTDPTYIPDTDTDSNSYGLCVYPSFMGLGSQSFKATTMIGSESTCPAENTCLSTACPTEDACKIQGLSFTETKIVGSKTIPKPQQHFCLFCGKPQSRLPRHLETKHKDEKAMVPYLDAKPGSKEKKLQLTKLRNAGDHQNNVRVLKNRAGTLVVKRRKRHSPLVNNFLPCPYCLGYFQKKDIYRHKCVQACDGPRREFVRKGKLMMPDVECEEEESEAFLTFLNTLQHDQIRVVVKTDPLIKDLAKRQVRRHGYNQSRFGDIRNKVREIARLLLKLREVSALENASLKDFLTPKMFATIIKVTKQIAGYEAEKFAFRIPSLATKLGHTLKTCAEMLEVQALETMDERLKCDIQGYLKLHEVRWNEEISAHARRNLYEKNKRSAKRLPLSRDVTQLSTHLSCVSESATQTLSTALEQMEIKEAWKSLAEVTLTQIILFNRRRSGEASKIKLEDLDQQETHDVDVLESLSNFEKVLCNKLTRIETFGKRGQIVPVLLTKQMKTAVDLLVQKRDAAGVSHTNKFVFACPFFQSEGHIRGSDTLRKFVSSMHLAEPQLITSTSLRKQVATMAQIVSLKDNEMDALAQFLGHDIHREYYRLPLDIMQVAKVSKLLLALEEGRLLDHQHCSLNDMEVAEDEDITSEEEAEQYTPGRSAATNKRTSYSQSSPVYEPPTAATDSTADEEYHYEQLAKKCRSRATCNNSTQS